MLNNETRRKLLELGLPEMVAAIDIQNGDSNYAGLSFDERIGYITDYVYQEKFNQRVTRLIKQSKFRVAADVKSIDYSDRGFTRDDILRISDCSFINKHTSVIIHGPTGSGKTYLGCAIGKEACKQRIKTRYIRMPDLIMEYDEFANITHGKQFLFELIERRYDNTATIFCTQYPKKDWHSRLGGGIHADSIMDRIVHNSTWIFTGTKNMREATAKADID
ncbi:MAG: ATP-binding protein [bacterium]|nr:ATP-binding protein [bacterium]